MKKTIFTGALEAGTGKTCFAREKNLGNFRVYLLKMDGNKLPLLIYCPRV